MKSHYLLALAALLSGPLFSSHAATPQQANLLPAVLGTANDSDFDGQWETHHHTCCLAYNGLPSTYNFRSAIEFDLSFLPTPAALHSATFYIRYDGANGLPGDKLEFNSYVADGVLAFADFTQVNQIALLNTFGPGDGTLWYKVPATAAAKSVLDQNGSHLGLMIQNIEWGQTPLVDPYLAVTFVPEPGTATILSLAAGLSFCRGRNSRRAVP